MQNRRVMTAALLACLAGAAAPPLLGAQIGVQRERNAPSVYAITNAKIITVAGPTIEKGTVVVRNGIITGVGASAAVPADARVIDGTGLTVYPGLIDANSSLGFSTTPANEVASAGRGGRGGRGGAVQQGTSIAARNSTKPVGLQPELAAIDFVHPDPDGFAGPHAAGVTTALSAPPTGIFRGLSAVVNLGGLTPAAMILRPNVAEHIGFTPTRGNEYPNSLLGVFSALRQSLYDAQHYAAENAAYAKNPKSMRRPDPDPSLEALQPVLKREIPVIMEASSKREIERALDLAKEFNLRAIIAGGEEADQVATRLKAENVPVLASLNFPRRPQSTADADPEPLRMLEARVNAPKLAAKLQAAGIRFAFEGDGASWSAFLPNVAKTVDNGLTADQAIRALTLTPAEILGVSDRLGTIETGKIANLTMTRGDLFTGHVTQVFVDGTPIEARAPANANGAVAMGTGTWQLTVTLDEGEKPATFTLQQVGDQLRGTMQGSLGSGQISDGSISSTGEVGFRVTVTMAAGTEEARFAGSIEGNVMRGTVRIVGHPQGTFIGTKPVGGQNGRGRGNPPHNGRQPTANGHQPSARR